MAHFIIEVTKYMTVSLEVRSIRGPPDKNLMTKPLRWWEGTKGSEFGMNQTGWKA